MEALRAAGRAVLRSPSLARHRLGVSRLRRPRQPVPESWAEMREPLLEGMSFALKYLGMTLVEKPKGEEMAAAAIHRILATARVGNKKFQKVILTVSPRGLSLQDAETQDTIACISIYRISYCTTDKLQNKVFAYVAQNPQSGALECHAFLSPKKKVAQAVTLTVAQAFHVALDLWEAAQAGSRGVEEEGEGQEKAKGRQPQSPRCPMESTCPPVPSPVGSPPFKTDFEEEEEEEEEDDADLTPETLAGYGGACLWELPSHTLPLGGGLGLQSPQQLPASRSPLLRLCRGFTVLPRGYSSPAPLPPPPLPPRPQSRKDHKPHPVSFPDKLQAPVPTRRAT
ncbi:low density lipoprotein receptor adapter protein 1 isoform X2 [Pogona vitticeps]